jgi:hypothetical protein
MSALAERFLDEVKAKYKAGKRRKLLYSEYRLMILNCYKNEHEASFDLNRLEKILWPDGGTK